MYVSPIRFETNFTRAWTRLGKPMVTVVLNESEWTLIGDVTRDPLLDAYVDSDGNKVLLDTLWETKDVRVVPTVQDSIQLDVGFAAVEESGRMSFIVSMSDYDDVEKCFRVIILGRQYVLEQIQPTPHAYPVFATFTVSQWKGKDEYTYK